MLIIDECAYLFCYSYSVSATLPSGILQVSVWKFVDCDDNNEKESTSDVSQCTVRIISHLNNKIKVASWNASNVQFNRLSKTNYTRLF